VKIFNANRDPFQRARTPRFGLHVLRFSNPSFFKGTLEKRVRCGVQFVTHLFVALDERRT
jgi:hypothetical protein